MRLNATVCDFFSCYNGVAPEERSVITWMSERTRQSEMTAHTTKADSKASAALRRMMARDTIKKKLRAYLALCHGEDASEAFPNLAGFCRYLGVGIREFCAVGEQYPDAYDSVMTELEDEALNARHLPANSASLTAAYFKRRLGYEAQEHGERGESEVRVVFDHDIAQAGA